MDTDNDQPQTDNDQPEIDQTAAPADVQPVDNGPPVPVITVTDEQMTFVAKAMDVDGKLDWDSTDHDHVVAVENAKALAKQMILGFVATSQMPEGYEDNPPPQQEGVELRRAN